MAGMSDNAGHAAIETLRRIEERLLELARRWHAPTGRDVATEILKAIYETRGDDPNEVRRAINEL